MMVPWIVVGEKVAVLEVGVTELVVPLHSKTTDDELIHRAEI